MSFQGRLPGVATSQRLRKVQLEQGAEPTDIDLVLVAGCSTRPVETWRILSWHSLLSMTGAKVQILAFDHQISADDRFSWQSLLLEGMHLLDAVQARREMLDEMERPLIFMSHSLGGLIVKQALAIANLQHIKYHQILTAVLGLVFLGTPHSLKRTNTLGDKTTTILKALSSDLSKQTLSRVETDAHLLLDLARRFEDITIRADILSIHETKETKIKEGLLFHRPRKAIIVDQAFARVNALHETSIATNLDHASLPELGDVDATIQQEIGRWLREVLEGAKKKIQDRLQAYHISESPTVSERTQFSVVSDSAAIQALSEQTSIVTRPGIGTGSASYGSSDFDYEMVPIMKGFETSRRQAKLPCFMVDTFSRNEGFFGRNDILQRLDELLLPSQQASVSSETGRMKYVALCGIPGVGKTEIALEFVFSRRHLFDAVFWVRADEMEKLEFDFSQIAVRLELEDSSELQNSVVSREMAKGWLANPKKLLDTTSDTVGQAEAKWLVIFDNADDPDILNELKPLFGNSSILITSRDPNAKTAFSSQPMGIDLEPFKDDEAGEWLRGLVARGTEIEACQIAHRLGGLPLAISQMAGMIRKQYLHLSDFIGLYDDEQEHETLHGLSLGSQRETARGTISTIWSVANLTASARVLLEIASFLDPERIQERVFSNVPENEVMLADFPRRQGPFAAARAELIQSALVRRQDDKKKLWIHRLCRDSVRSKMPIERQTQVFRAAVAIIDAAWPKVTPDQRHSTARWAECEELYPHVIAFKTYYEKRFDDGNIEADFGFASLLHEAGWWQHERGNSHHVKSFLSLAQRICEQIGDSKGDTLDLLGNIHYALGAVANETNDRESCISHTQSLLSMRLDDVNRGGQPSIHLAIAYNENGIGFMMVGKHKEAEDCFEKAIETYQSLPNFWVGMISLPLANLGLAYWLQGRLDEAHGTLARSLREREDHFAGGQEKDDSFRTGRILHGLGNVQFDRGLVAESENFHQRALQHYQSTIGSMHHRTADVCHRVAQHCIRRGDHESARTLLNQALTVWKANVAVYQPEVARSTFLLSKSYFSTDDKAPAISLFKEAVHLRHQIVHASLKSDHELLESDFDDLVTFWSK